MNKLLRVILICLVGALMLFSAACEKTVNSKAEDLNQGLGQDSHTFIPQEIQPIEANPFMLPQDIASESELHRLSVEGPQIDETMNCDDIIDAVLVSANQVAKLQNQELKDTIYVQTDEKSVKKTLSDGDGYISVLFQQENHDQDGTNQDNDNGVCGGIHFEKLSQYVFGMGDMNDSSNSAVLLKYRSSNAMGVPLGFSNSNIVTVLEIERSGQLNFWTNDDQSQDFLERRNVGTIIPIDNEWYYAMVAMDENYGYRFITWQESNPANNAYYACDLSKHVNFDDVRYGQHIYAQIESYTELNEVNIDIESLMVYEFEKYYDAESVDLNDDANGYHYADDYEKYQLAVDLFVNEDYYNAYLLLKELNGYDTSETYLAECERLLQTIEITDARIAKAITTAMVDCGMTINEYLYVYQAEKIERLDLSECSIRDLGFISKFVNLKELNLDGTGISDLTPIKDLYALEYLSLAKNNISDTKPLYNLTNLKYLDLSCNVLEYVKGLDGLKSLVELDLSTNNIVTIAGLYNLNNLESVDLSYNFISSVSALGNSPIKELNILNTVINNLSAVANFSELQVLKAGFYYIRAGNTDSYLITKKYENDDLWFAGISGLEFLAGHKNLKYLELARLDTQSLEALTTTPNLESLIFDLYTGPNGSDVFPRLVNLKELTLDSWTGAFDDMTFLKYLINLEKLSILGWCHVEDLSIISELTNLTELRMCQYGESLDFLTELDNLKLLQLIGWVHIKDYSPLLALDNLEYLYLNDMKVHDLSVISRIETLKHLSIGSWAEINSIEGVQNMENLEYFKLEGERVIGDYSPERFDASLFYGLENLRYVKVKEGNGENNVDLRLYDANIEKDYQEYPVGDRVFLREMYDTGNLERLNALADYNSHQDFFIWTSDMQDGGVTKLTIPENVRNLYISSGTDTPVKLELDCADHKGLERIVIGCIDLSEGGRNPFGEGTFVIEDLDFLEGCTNLKEIYIDSIGVKDISGLAGCDKLEIVHLQGNNITDISALADKKYLKELYLSDNSITNMEALESCIRLQIVNLDGNQ